MRRMGFEQIVVTSPASIHYLIGQWIEPMERLFALLVDDAGDAVLFGNAMLGIEAIDGLPLRLHRDDDDPLRDLAAAAKPGIMGIDKHWYSKFLLALTEKRPDIKPKLGSLPVDAARMLKDEAEIAAMRRSSRINDEVMAASLPAMREGIREDELAERIGKEYAKRGAAPDGARLVCFGPNGADPHHMPGGAPLRAGDGAVLDIFAPIDRYWCDMTRTVFYRSAGDKQRAVHETVRRANEAAIARIKPGIALSELDKIARDVISDAGYGPFFTHRLGHGCGLECHEPPDVSASSDAVLEPGMIFSVEPGVYLPGEFGVRVEDLVLVTADGCEVLNKFTKDLLVIQ
jgi:Xaa-Pro dipeptidase